VTVRGTDTSTLYTDGVIKVVVQGINDPPIIDIDDPTYPARARETLIVDLADDVWDPDGDNVTLTTNSSHITVEDMVLYCLFDVQGTYDVQLKVSDGIEETNETLTFEVTPARGFPSIVGLPTEFILPVNRPLPIDLMQFGEDEDDDPGDLVWTVEEDSDLFEVNMSSDGFNITITPTKVDLGSDPLTLTVTNTKDNSVTEQVRINITEREKTPPRINHETLPEKIKLTKGGDPEVIILADHVEDEFTPIDQLRVDLAYTKEGVVYVDVQGGVLSFVPQDLGKTQVTVTLTNLDDRSSSFVVDIEVVEKDDGEPINWTFLIIVLFIIVAILLLFFWPRKSAGAVTAEPKSSAEALAVPAARVEKVKPHTFRSSSMKALEEVMLFHSSGLLISTYTRQLKEGLDADLEGAVISAVQDQIRGRLRTRDEPTDLIELEGMNVVIERGADVAIAAVLSGAAPVGMRVHLRRGLMEVQTRNQAVLPEWDGDLGQLRGVDNAMVNLVEALIREHNGSQDLAVDGETVGKEEEHHTPPAIVDGVPPLEDDDEPLHLVKDIIGEEKTREIEEGRHRSKDDEWEEGE
jgi:hypothetical protein